MLSEEIELLRVELLEHFGSLDQIPNRLREAFIGAAMSTVELAAIHGDNQPLTVPSRQKAVQG